MSAPGYRKFIAWIAANDESAATEAEDIVGLATVAMVADLFGKNQDKVAVDVIAFRQRERAKND